MSQSASRLGLFQAAFVVARRDFLAILFSKAFLFFLLGPFLFLGIMTASAAAGGAAAKSRVDPALAVALSAAETQAFVAAHERLVDPIDLPDIHTYPADSDIATLLADEDRNIAAVLTGTLDAPVLSGTQDRIERWEGQVALVAGQAMASESGSVPAMPPVRGEPTESSSASTRDLNSLIATGGITTLFLLTMLLAGMVLSNLVEEKGNKIIEILAASIPMDAVFMGKLFAMLAVSLVGIAVWGGVFGLLVVLGAQALPPELIDIPSPAVGWPVFLVLFVVYFAMAYCLIGSVFLAVGAMAPTVRDVQTISMPATMLQLAVFFLATFALGDIGSPVELFAVGFPLSSPYAMVGRAAQQATLWPHLVALAWQALWVAIFIRAGSGLFRKVVMKSGSGGASGKKRGWKALFAR